MYTLVADRANVEDLARNDDLISITYKKTALNRKKFIFEDLPILIEGFDAYYVSVCKFDFYSYSSDNMKFRDVHDGMSVFYPVFFMDSTLCERWFGMSLYDAKSTLEPVVEKVMQLGNGLCVVVSSEINPIEKDIKNDRRIRKFLGL